MPRVSTESVVERLESSRYGDSQYYRIRTDDQMVQDVERDEAKFTFGDKEDVFSVAGVLKQCELVVSQIRNELTERSARTT
jgi:hypothetical protein